MQFRRILQVFAIKARWGSAALHGLEPWEVCFKRVLFVMLCLGLALLAASVSETRTQARSRVVRSGGFVEIRSRTA